MNYDPTIAPDSPEMISRREALRRTAWLMGGIVSGPAVAALLQGCRPQPRLDWRPVFFSADQAKLVTALAETIIPKTDTPGAKDIGVPAFIDEILQKVYSDEDRTRFMSGLTEFAEACAKQQGRPFAELNATQQLEFTKSVHDPAVERERAGETATDERPFILAMKELTLLGFFTSEVGATQFLQYVPVPGVQRGCIPLSEAGDGRAWAL